MTLVRFAYSKPSATGRDAAVHGELQLSLVHRETVGGRLRTTNVLAVTLEPTEVIVPESIDESGQSLPATSCWAGVAVVELSPTALDQAWEVVEGSSIGGRRTPAPVFAVPVSAGVVQATDLVELDRASLEPAVSALQAWEVAVAQAGEYLTGAQNAASQAESSAITANASAGAASDSAAYAASVASSVGASVDSAAQSASDAAGSATESAAYATNAAGSATDAAGSATAAEVARQAARAAADEVPALLATYVPRSSTQVGVDTDGVPYFSDALAFADAVPVLTDTDGVPYLAA